MGVSPLVTEWKIPDSGITLSPPGTLDPAVSHDAAYELCMNGVADCDPGQPSSIQLALASDSGSGQLDTSGNLVPLMDDTLVWAISWLGISCPPGSGGPAVTPSPDGNAPAASIQPLCDKIAFVDASSGKFIFTYLTGHE